MVITQGLTEEKEGGARCSACFNMRLDLVAQKAQELGYDYFGSALTISPKKNAALINQIGMDIQKIYGTHYLPSDFKKNKGYGTAEHINALKKFGPCRLHRKSFIGHFV